MSELYTKYATEQYVKSASNTALNSAKEYVDTIINGLATEEYVEEAVSSLDTIIATDENSDGNIVLRPYIPEEDFIQVDKTLTIEGAAADAKAVGDRIANLVVSGDAPVLDAVLDANGIMTYNNSPAFDEWLTEVEGSEKFAPSGYGLGETLGKYCADCHAVNEVGFYYINNQTLNRPDGVSSGTLMVEKRTGSKGEETYLTMKMGTSEVRKIYSSYEGAWQPWEWENPPMTLGTEYRTTERYKGYPVFTKLIDLGNPTNGKRVNTGHGNLIRHSGNLNLTTSLPFAVYKSASSDYWAESYNDGAALVIGCGIGFATTSYVWYEQIWWI